MQHIFTATVILVSNGGLLARPLEIAFISHSAISVAQAASTAQKQQAPPQLLVAGL